MKNNKIILGQFLMFSAGIIAGLFLARKSGKELKRDAEEQMKRMKTRSRKELRNFKHSMNNLKSKFDNDNDFKTTVSDTFKTIKQKTHDLGENVEKLIKKK
jgi:gas vesicle protein